MQVVRSANVTQRAETEQAEIASHEAVTKSRAATGAKVDGVHVAIGLEEMSRIVAGGKAQAVVVIRDAPDVGHQCIRIRKDERAHRESQHRMKAAVLAAHRVALGIRLRKVKRREPTVEHHQRHGNPRGNPAEV